MIIIRKDKKPQVNALLDVFYKWDVSNKRIFANKTERAAAELLLEIGEAEWWRKLILKDKFFDEVYETKFFPSNLVSYKPTEMLRNYKKIKAWVNRNL